MKIADLFAEITFKWDSLKLKELVGLVGNLNVSSVAGLVGMDKLGAVVDDVIKSTDNLAGSLTTLQDTTGIDPVYAQQLRALSEAYYGTAQGADALVTSLSKVNLQIARGHNPEAATAMGMFEMDQNADLQTQINQLGSFLSNPEKLNSILGNFPGQSKKEKEASLDTYLASTLGVTGEMINPLKHIGEVGEFAAASPELLKEQAEAHKEFSKASHELSIQLIRVIVPFENLTTALLTFVNKFNIIATAFDWTKKSVKSVVTGGESVWMTPKIKEMLDKGKHSYFDMVNKLFVDPLIHTAPATSHQTHTNDFKFTIYAQDAEDYLRKSNDLVHRHINLTDAGFGGGIKK